MPVREILARRGLGAVSKWFAERLRDILAHDLELEVTSEVNPKRMYAKAQFAQRRRWCNQMVA